VELDGKVAIVTGAGGAGVGGLGVTYATALAAEGAAVVVADLDGAAATRVADGLVRNGARAVGVGCDVTIDDDIDAMVRAARDAFDGVDILVNNAGLARGKWNEGATLPTDDWLQILAVNTVAPIACARACRPVMRERGGGVVVNQSSSGAYMESGAYTVSKAALNAVTRVLAAEFAEDRIRVNGIAPGMMTAQLPAEMIEMMLARQTVRRQGRPDDLIGALLFLCSDQSAFVNGQTLLVDGGVARGGV
jgi:NAD(P)-dependent dehydrogenase (short-subunit alcohol dehydrogenase family)